MAAFICDRCGRCCVSLGQSITIERQLNGRDYYCRSAIDNAIVPVHVDPAFREEIADAFAGENSPLPGAETKSCPFLKKDPESGKMVCVIYSTRPRVCRDFRCYRMVICNREGVICGKVIGRNTLRTADPALEKVWDGQVMPDTCRDPASWTARVVAILADHGYRGEPAE